MQKSLNIDGLMNFEIVYKKSLNRSFAGLSINGRYMERLDGNRLYILLGDEKILDFFYLENSVECQIKSKKNLSCFLEKGIMCFLS